MDNTKNDNVKQFCDEYVKKTPDLLRPSQYSQSHMIGQKRRYGVAAPVGGTQIGRGPSSRVSKYNRAGAHSEMVNFRQTKNDLKMDQRTKKRIDQEMKLKKIMN